MDEQGFDADVIERCLAHIEQNKVRKTYHPSEYLDARRDLLQWWADYLDGLKAGAKVIPFRQSSAT